MYSQKKRKKFPKLVEKGPSRSFVSKRLKYTYDEERRVTKPTPRPRYKAVANVPNFDTLVPAPELSLTDPKNNPFRKMRDTLYREQQLWSGNENVEIRYVSGSSEAGT